MLVLSRRKLESIYLDGGRIEVTVLSVQGNRVRLGITAPPDISVQREEVQRRLALEALAIRSNHSQSQVRRDTAVRECVLVS